MIKFEALTIGNEYNRPTLAKLWGYKSFNAISRGVFSPQGMDILIFFITKEKQVTLTQYENHIDSDVLFWEGEKGHGSDRGYLKEETKSISFTERDTIAIFNPIK